MKKQQAVILNSKDNVATAVTDLPVGTKVNIECQNQVLEVTMVDNIPFGHKFAVRSIEKEKDIIKYGESIGRAVCDITKGHYVHIHNVESKRGRGDWEKEVKTS